MHRVMLARMRSLQFAATASATAFVSVVMQSDVHAAAVLWWSGSCLIFLAGLGRQVP